MKANNPLTDPIEQPKKSASLMGLPTPAPIYRNLVVVHYHLRPGGVRRIIELALRHIALAAPNSLAAIVLATGEKPETQLARNPDAKPAWDAGAFLLRTRFSLFVGAAIITRGDSRKSALGSRKVGPNLSTR